MWIFYFPKQQSSVHYLVLQGNSDRLALLPTAISRASEVQPWIFSVHVSTGRYQLSCILFQTPKEENKKTCSRFSSTLISSWFQDLKHEVAQPREKGFLCTWAPHSTELFVVLLGTPEQPQFFRWKTLKAAFCCWSWPRWHKHARGRTVTEYADGCLIFKQSRVHRHFIWTFLLGHSKPAHYCRASIVNLNEKYCCVVRSSPKRFAFIWHCFSVLSSSGTDWDGSTKNRKTFPEPQHSLKSKVWHCQSTPRHPNPAATVGKFLTRFLLSPWLSVIPHPCPLKPATSAPEGVGWLWVSAQKDEKKHGMGKNVWQINPMERKSQDRGNGKAIWREVSPSTII